MYCCFRFFLLVNATDIDSAENMHRVGTDFRFKNIYSASPLEGRKHDCGKTSSSSIYSWKLVFQKLDSVV